MNHQWQIPTKWPQNDRSPDLLRPQDEQIVARTALRRVLVVDRVTLTRQSLAHGLRTQWLGSRDCLVVDELADIHQTPAVRPDLVIVAVRAMSESSCGPARDICQIVEHFGDVPVVLLADGEDPLVAAAALRSRLRGYLSTAATPAVVGAAVHLVLAGGVYLPELLLTAFGEMPDGVPPNQDPPSHQPDTALLTQREAEVIAKLREGKPNKLIAWELRISEGTVKVHVRSIMRKLHATNRTQVALRGHRIHAPTSYC